MSTCTYCACSKCTSHTFMTRSENMGEPAVLIRLSCSSTSKALERKQPLTYNHRLQSVCSISQMYTEQFPVEDLQPSGATLLTSGCWSGQISLALELRVGWRSEWAAVRPQCPPLWSPTSAWSDRASGPSGRPWRPPAPDSPSRTAGNGHSDTACQRKMTFVCSADISCILTHKQFSANKSYLSLVIQYYCVQKLGLDFLEFSMLKQKLSSQSTSNAALTESMFPMMQL